MKYKSKATTLLILLVVISVCGFVGCVPDQSEYEYLFDYWCAEWYGWYEITDATGQYAHLKGDRSDCIAQSKYSPRLVYCLDVYDPEGEALFNFNGYYGHDPEKKYGAVELYDISFNPAYVEEIFATESGLPYNIPVKFTVDGEGHGIEELAVCKGTVGEGEDMLTMELYLRHWGVRWEDLKEYTGDAFGGRAYPDCLPPNYAAYAAIFQEAEFREQLEAFWLREQYGWHGRYTVTDATGELAEYATANTDCEAKLSVDHAFKNSLRYKYNIDLRSPEANHIFTLYGPWEQDGENKMGSIIIECIAGWPAQGRAVVSPDDPYMVVIQAQVNAENGNSMKIEVQLRPKVMAGDERKQKSIDGTQKSEVYSYFLRFVQDTQTENFYTKSRNLKKSVGCRILNS